MVKKYYVDKVLIVLENENKYYLEKEIDEKLLEYIYSGIRKNVIKRIEAESVEALKSIIIFIDGTYFHLGIVDMYNEVNYYLDNSCGDLSLVELAGNYFEKRFVHNDIRILQNVFEKFISSGEISEVSNWYID